MKYFFPGIIKSKSEFKKIEPLTGFSIDSGEHAIRILLKSMNFKQGVKVAIPAFVCTSVSKAVMDEGLTPFYLDLKKDGTFITDYDFEIIKRENVSALILVHLYGVLHPDNKIIEEFCLKHHIFLIQDLAQSYGLNVENFNPYFPIIYSFGPGKSSTAAGGAIIHWEHNSLKKINLPYPSIIQKIKAHLFLISRIFGREKNFFESIVQKVLNKFYSHGYEITRMSTFQLKAAHFVMDKFHLVANERLQRWDIIDEACKKNKYLKNAMPKTPNLGFKYIINAYGYQVPFAKYLQQNNVPYYCLGNDIEKHINSEMNNFKNFATSFIEISCEASIPLAEIHRVAEIISKFSA